MSLLRRRAALARPASGWRFDTRVSAASGLNIPVPSGFEVAFWDDFTSYSTVTDLEAATFAGSSVYSAYSGQDAAYASGFWAKSHVTFESGQLVLNGYFDAAAHATKYVTGGFAAYGLAAAGHVPEGSMWVWCAREESAGGQPIKAVGMTYGTLWPPAGAFTKLDGSGTNVGNAYAEWPYCGEDDHRESDQGSASNTTTLHWHDPALVSTGNRTGHHQDQIGTLSLDHSAWHIYGIRTDSGSTNVYRGFTNDNATTDVPLREWITKSGVDNAFAQSGKRFIYQQEAWGQPAGGTGTKKIYLDWVALLVPISDSPTAPRFYEDWSTFTAGDTSWTDGSVHGRWTDVFGGFGSVGVELDSGIKVLTETPAPPTASSNTSACLVRTTQTFNGDVDITFRMKTVSQTRTGAYSGAVANDWERAWAIWHYTDNTHFYYVYLKAGGWELGKEDPAYPGAQRFLLTPTTPTYALGGWNTVRVRQVGATITVFVDGAEIGAYTDTERPYTSGSVALYNEDSHVRFGPTTVA